MSRVDTAPVMALLDREGCIRRADDRLMALQDRGPGGGRGDGPFAIPALAALVRLALQLGTPLSRPVEGRARSGRHQRLGTGPARGRRPAPPVARLAGAPPAPAHVARRGARGDARSGASGVGLAGRRSDALLQSRSRRGADRSCRAAGWARRSRPFSHWRTVALATRLAASAPCRWFRRWCAT